MPRQHVRRTATLRRWRNLLRDLLDASTTLRNEVDYRFGDVPEAGDRDGSQADATGRAVRVGDFDWVESPHSQDSHEEQHTNRSPSSGTIATGELG